MKKLLLLSVGSLALFGLILYAGTLLVSPNLITEDEENEMYDGPDQADALEFEKTRDISLNRVPKERLLPALEAAAQSKTRRSASTASLLSWTERGPNSDSVGPSNGNSRANSGITGGRIRAILVDANDPSGKTVFVGGVDGGLWKTTDITAPAPTWNNVNDFLSNLAVSDIVQDPRPGFSNIMYFGTGEGYRNADAVRGNGIFKSIDGGATWSYLPSTSGFIYTTRLAIDNAGNLYAGTRISGGLYRSSDGGGSWTNITPNGLTSVDVCDLDISSTGRLHAVFGIITTNGYRFTDSPASVSPSSGWTSATTPFTVSSVRTELAVSGNTLYAAPSDGSYQVPTIFKSTNGGVDWAATTAQPTSGWASQQAWYALSIAINPSDSNQVIVGGLDNYKSPDGGATWSKISAWVGTSGQYIHADQHKSVWYDGGNKLLFGSDGGVFYSTDGGSTTRDRNTGLRIKQFYSIAMRPEAGSNYLLAGAQDNGTHSLSNAGLDASVEVTGGDGAFVAIDQLNGNNQFGAYVYNQYRYSSNGGASWSSRNFSSSLGRFINPFELDSVNKIIYAADANNVYRRWPNVPTGTSSSAITVANMGGQVSSVTVSPYTDKRVIFGTGSGTIVRVDGADTFVSGGNGTVMSTGIAAGVYVSNVAYGTNESNLIASVSNFGTAHVYVTTDGSNWTNVSGNLPDMPVRWAIFKPNSNTGAIIATDAGVWETDSINGSSTVWTADPTFPSVRVDMIRYRASDGMLAAGTHGRGAWVSASLVAPKSRTPFDYDGDGKADVSVYRPSNNTWFLQNSQSGFAAFQFGAAGDKLVPADYTGDGKTDVAVYRPTTGWWYVLRSEDSTFYGASFGIATDTPAPGDYDGDGKADLAVYRPGVQSVFFIQRSNLGFTAVTFGVAEDKPTVGDFDGDGKADIAVYRPSLGQWYRYNSSNGVFVGNQFGTLGDMVVPADYTGDGKTDLAVFRPSNSTWYIQKSDDGSFYGVQFGATGDIPGPGDFDGDGKADPGVFRPLTGTWFEQNSTSGFTAVSFGLNGDLPTLNAFVY